MLRANQYSAFIKTQASDLGFDFCGIAKADFLEEEAPRLEQWLSLNHHGKMGYMANHFDKRLDPRLLVEGAESVVSLLYNYYPEAKLPEETDALKISKYAYGLDYHVVIKEKLKELLFRIQENIGQVNGRAFVDSAPVMDKAWAKRAGLGWVGKHTNLLNRQMGSFFFIAELIIDLPLGSDTPTEDFCGTCTRCLDACPTEALIAPYQIDGSRCISYYTIELKEAIPEEVRGKFNNWIFGCDICQDVCPWNRFAKPHNEEKFLLNTDLQNFTRADWTEITAEVFNRVFKESPIKRTKLEGLQRNIAFVQNET